MYKNISKTHVNNYFIFILYLLCIIMNINEFFDIAQEFFDTLNPNFCEDYFEENSECEFLKICEEFFYQIGPQI